jgi:hypothetical protein
VSEATADDTARFQRDGHVVCRGLLTPERCEALNAALSTLIERAAVQHARGALEDDFWRQMPRSAHAIEVFWMPESPGLPRFAESRVMRVGHVLHSKDPTFADLAFRSPVTRALVSVLGAGARVVQSAVVYKQPHDERVQFGFHQDAAYLTTEPAAGALALAFVALDDADADNGALVVAPGSHRAGLDEWLRLGDQGFERGGGMARPIERGAGVLLTMRRGDVALVDGLTYHASDPNHSSRRRRALIVHAMSSQARLRPSAWVQEPAGGFTELAPHVPHHDQ